MNAAILLPLIPAAIPFATRDIDQRIAAGEALASHRDHLIRVNAAAIACSAHLRRMAVADYVERFAPELTDEQSAIRDAIAAAGKTKVAA